MNKVIKEPGSILITGASSGLGAALALYYARSSKTLFLSGRNKGRLLEVGKSCRDKGALVFEEIIDVTDRRGMKAWINSSDQKAPLDLVIANAGISGGTGGYKYNEPEQQVREIFDVNVSGVFNTIDPALDLMKVRRQGQIAIMSSLASFSPWPGAPAYSASKCAVRSYGESLRGAVMPSGVFVSVICPGFIRTPLTAVNNYKMPFLMKTDRAASIIAKGLGKNKARIAFPWQTYFFAGLLGLLPPSLILKITSRLPEKPANS